MGKSVRIKVDETLQQTLERIRREVAEDMKKRYGLKEVTIHGTVASQVLAAKLSGRHSLNFTIEKNGLNKGILKLF